MDNINFSENLTAEDGEQTAKPEQIAKNVCNDEEIRKCEDLSINLGGSAPSQMSRKEIEESLSQILNGMEEKRKQDMKIIEDAVTEIMAQAKKSCEILEQNMIHMHTVKSKLLNEELKKLFEVLDNVKKAENELETSKKSLHILCQEIQKPFV